MDWLAAVRTFPGPTADAAGWLELGGSGDDGALESAVAAANGGKLVVAGYRQPAAPDATTGVTHQRPGHVVVVRPQESPWSAGDGPLVIMAGKRNWRSIHMRNAFKSHPAAWPEKIRLYVHDTDLEPDVPATAGVG